MEWIILLVQVLFILVLAKHKRDLILNLSALELPGLFKSKEHRLLTLNNNIDFQFKKRKVFFNFFFPLLLFKFCK